MSSEAWGGVFGVDLFGIKVFGAARTGGRIGGGGGGLEGGLLSRVSLGELLFDTLEPI